MRKIKEWLLALWEKVTVSLRDRDMTVIVDLTDQVTRVTVATVAAVVGVVLLFWPDDNAWAGPTADQLFKVATMMWSGAWTSP